MITETMILMDIVEKYPETEDIFHEYDAVIGKCLLCNNLFDSINDVVKDYKLNLNEILYKLNNAVK